MDMDIYNTDAMWLQYSCLVLIVRDIQYMYESRR